VGDNKHILNLRANTISDLFLLPFITPITLLNEELSREPLKIIKNSFVETTI